MVIVWHAVVIVMGGVILALIGSVVPVHVVVLLSVVEGIVLLVQVHLVSELTLLDELVEELMVSGLFIEGVWLEVSWEIIFVVKLSVVAKEDFGARLNHLWGKGKLLAVKYQGSLVFFDGLLHVV